MRISSVTPILWLFAVLVAGCASNPVTHATAPQLAQPAAGKGRIMFYRPNALFGYAQRGDILLDGKKVGESIPGEKFFVDTSIGTHRVSVPNILYSGDRAVSVLVEERETAYVRTSLGGSAFVGRTNVELVAPELGAQESASLALVEPK